MTPSTGINPTAGGGTNIASPTQEAGTIRTPINTPANGDPVSTVDPGEPEVTPDDIATQVIPTSSLPTVAVTPRAPEADAWRAQQRERVAFDQPVDVYAPGKVLLWWFDPRTQQHLPLGWIDSPFQAQAEFRLFGSWLEALEVPYLVNQSFGLTLDQSVLERMRQAGVSVDAPGALVEGYVLRAPDMEY